VLTCRGLISAGIEGIFSAEAPLTGNGSHPLAELPISLSKKERRLIMSFRIKGLPAEDFNHLFALTDEELAKLRVVRRVADDRQPGYPCRVSLTDSKPGDELLLVNYEHLPVESPYRMRFAVFVRKGDETYDKIDTVPEQLRQRTLAVRAFDRHGMMLSFELADGRELEPTIDKLFANANAEYLHVHFAAPGCYAARIERA
jgi:Protein of unknown function (DUF1203)